MKFAILFVASTLLGLSAPPALGESRIPAAPGFVSNDVSAAVGGAATVYASEFEPIPIALPVFLSASPGREDLARRLSAVIAADLERSSFFRLIGGPALTSIDVPPRIASWRGRGAKALIAGEVSIAEDGRLAVRFRLWSLTTSDQLVQLQFLADPTGWRRVAHKVADAVYAKLTGEAPYFDSRVVFVAESGPKEKRIKRLAIMDQDGANFTYLTNGADLVLAPRFSPVEQAIVFISYATGQPEVHLLNLETEVQEALGAFPGMTFAPRFSPDGERVVMSFSRGSGSDIYLMNLANGKRRQLTNSPGIDTSPSFAPDGSAIVFESDRGGSQQLYVMSPDGLDVRRISQNDGRYATPVWSPTGDLIAFTKMMGGQFHIGVMTPDGREERLLSSSFLDEAPTWAPNGRVLMFYREPPGSDAKPQLYSVDVFGRSLLRVPTPDGASDPAWSPLLTP
jgi:TolB protein